MNLSIAPLLLIPILFATVGYLLWLWAKRIVAREKLVAEAEEQRRREEIAQRPRLPSLHNSNPTFLDNSQRDLQPHLPPPPFATAMDQEEEDPPPSYEEAIKARLDQ